MTISTWPAAREFHFLEYGRGMSQLYMMSFRRSFDGREFPTRIEYVFRFVRGVNLPPFFEAVGLEEHPVDAERVRGFVNKSWPVNDESKAFTFVGPDNAPIGVVVASISFTNEDECEDHEPSGLALFPLHLDPGFHPYVADAYRLFTADFVATGNRKPYGASSN